MSGTPDHRPDPVVRDAPLRADARAKALATLEAADRLLRVNPSATMEQIARAAGASRATVHRHFATREALLVALSRWALGRIVAALEDARVHEGPAEEALFRATRNVIAAKVGLEYTRTLPPADDPLVAAAQERLRALAADVLTRCRDEGLIASGVDPQWALTTFYALVHEAAVQDSGATAPEERAARVVTTLLHGVGPRAGGPAGA